MPVAAEGEKRKETSCLPPAAIARPVGRLAAAGSTVKLHGGGLEALLLPAVVETGVGGVNTMRRMIPGS